MMEHKKVEVTLLLDEVVVKWLAKEAAKDGKTLDEVVNLRLLSQIFVNCLSEEEFNNLLMVMRKKGDGGMVS